MKLHQKLTLYFTALIILALLATSTFASCPMMNQGPPCAEYYRADAVFIGVATSVVRTPNETGLAIGMYSRSTVHFSVEEAFKGVEGTFLVFELDHCGHVFKESERYLVYAHYNSYTKKLEVRAGNTRTRPLAEAPDDLAYIRSLVFGERGSRVFGKVMQQGFKEGQFEVHPLRDIKISLESNTERREVVADSDGRYEFKGMPEGAYRVRLDVPTYMELSEATIKITGRGCVPFDIFAVYKNKLAGKVLDTNGNPVKNISVTLVSADASPEKILPRDNSNTGTGVTSYTLRDGTYRFTQLMPGRYLLIVNRKDHRSQSELARILPTLLYPGVHDIGAATVIVIANDKEPQAYDFVLPIQQ